MSNLTPDKTCSCGAPIAFVPSVATGRLVCLNVAPDEAKGNIVVVDGKARLVQRNALYEPVVAGPYYLSHQATCPDVDKYRKPKKK